MRSITGSLSAGVAEHFGTAGVAEHIWTAGTAKHVGVAGVAEQQPQWPESPELSTLLGIVMNHKPPAQHTMARIQAFEDIPELASIHIGTKSAKFKS